MSHRRTYQYLDASDVLPETIFLMNLVVNDKDFTIHDVPFELTPALECPSFSTFFGIKEDGVLVLSIVATNFLRRLASYSDESVTYH